MSINYDLPIAKVEVNNVEIPIVSGGGGDNAKALIEKTITEYIDTNNVSVIGDYAFYGCTSLSQSSFPVGSTIGSYAVHSCI